MLKRSSSITLNGRQFNLLLTTEALADIYDLYGDLEGMTAKMNEGGYRDKMRTACEVLSILANCGEDAKGSEDRFTADWFFRYSFPTDFIAMSGAITEAMNKGLNVEAPAPEGGTDEVLAEIEKNVLSAAET